MYSRPSCPPARRNTSPAAAAAAAGPRRDVFGWLLLTTACAAAAWLAWPTVPTHTPAVVLPHASDASGAATWPGPAEALVPQAAPGAQAPAAPTPGPVFRPPVANAVHAPREAAAVRIQRGLSGSLGERAAALQVLQGCLDAQRLQRVAAAMASLTAPAEALLARWHDDCAGVAEQFPDAKLVRDAAASGLPLGAWDTRGGRPMASAAQALAARQGGLLAAVAPTRPDLEWTQALGLPEADEPGAQPGLALAACTLQNDCDRHPLLLQACLERGECSHASLRDVLAASLPAAHFDAALRVADRALALPGR